MRIDNMGHEFELSWQETDTPHPGYLPDIYGSYVDQCMKCGMYGYEFRNLGSRPGKYEGHLVEKKLEQ